MPAPTSRTTLKPLAIAHPVVILASYAVIAGLLYWAYRTDFQQPDIWISLPVVTLIMIIGDASRRKRARRGRTRPAVHKPVLDIDAA